MSRCLAVAALGLLVSAAAAAATVYRWTDEQGKVHYAEVVPQRYRSVARPLGPLADVPTAEQLQQAQERAGRDMARAASIQTARDLAPSDAASAAPASTRATRRPTQVPDEQTDCDTWQRLYVESVECFGPYRTVRGGIKPDGHDACNVVPEPPPGRCTPRVPSAPPRRPTFP